MPAMSAHANPPEPWYLISLRPSGNHGALRRAAARHAGRVLAASPWRLQQPRDDATRQALRQALAAPVVIFTSPAAVDAAHALQPLVRPDAAVWMSVGAGSAYALQRHGVGAVLWPERMDSEGLLALPPLAMRLPGTIGLVTAPGGRGLLLPALEQRGGSVLRADVYRRVALPLSTATLDRLATHAERALLALSSAEALARVLPQLPDAVAQAWRRRPVVASSARLEALAREQGFVEVRRSTGPRPAQLAATAAAIMTPQRHD